MIFLSSKKQNIVNNSCNTQDPNIQFTVEEPDVFLPFLDTKVTPGLKNTLITTVYRKATHRDQYLHWDSNQFITAKHSVYNTLAHRGKVVSSSQPSLIKELDNITLALQACHFPTWAFNKLQHNFECRHYSNSKPSSTDSQQNSNHNNNGTSSTNNNRKHFNGGSIYTGIGEKFKWTYNKKGIQIQFKHSNIIKTLCMAPKDKDTKLQKSGVIYKYK